MPLFGKSFISATVLLASQLGRLVYAARSETDETLDRDAIQETMGCSNVLATGTCIVVTKFIIENTAGMGRDNLMCMQQWCSAGKQNCCETINGIKKELAGATAASLRIPLFQFQNLLDAVGMTAQEASNGFQPPQQVSVTGQVVSTAFQQPQQRTAAQSAETEVAKMRARSNNSDPRYTGVDPDMCLCIIGGRAVNLAGYGPYPKTNYQLKGPSGGKCTGPCTQCTRELGKDRFPCCERKVDGTLGKCGEEQKKPFFNSETCICGGHVVLKSLIHEQRSCLPSTKCSECRYHTQQCL